MKKTLRLIATASLLFCMSSSFAATNASDKSVEEARKLNVKNMLTQLNYLTKLTVRYVNLTLDTTPTRGEIENYFNKKDLDLWKNYRNENCTETDGSCDDNITGGIALAFDVANNKLEFENIMGDIATLSPIEVQTYQNYKNYDGIGQLSVDETKINFDFFNFPSLESTLSTIENCNDNPELVCSAEEPIDQTKQWIKPKGDGTFETLSYDVNTSEWKKYKEDKDGNLIFYTSDNFDPTTTPGVKGQYALNQTEDGWIEYIHDGTEWIPKVTGSTGVAAPFNGTGTIIAMATTKFNSTGGSIMTSPAPNGEWGGTLEFTKLEDATYGGYWKTAANNYMVTNTAESLNYFSDNFLVGTVAWIANGSNDVIKLEKRTLPDASVEWVYIASDYADLQNFIETEQNGNVGTYIYVSSHGEYFYFDTDVFKPHPSGAGVTYVTFSANARNQFIPTTGKIYLSQTNDCDISNCNGDVGTGYYAGEIIENLFVFYYAVSGKRQNDLIDAIPRSTLAEVYDNGDTASLIGSDLYFKSTDSRGRTIYKRSDDTFWTRAGAEIPSYLVVGGVVNLPPDYEGSNVVITGGGINVDTVTKALNWTDAPNGAKIVLSSVTYTHNTSIGKDFWTDNNTGDGQASATKIFTAYGRSMLPNITNSAISVYTNELCTNNPTCLKTDALEPRYTDNGVSSSTAPFTGMNQWFYSLSGSNVSNLLDPQLCSSGNECYSSITPLVLHNTDGLLTKVGDYYIRSSDGKELVNNEYSHFTNNSAVHSNASRYNSATGLYYDVGNSARNWNNSNSLCLGKGMRLPDVNEVSAIISGGITHFTSNSWTSTYGHLDGHFYWLGANATYTYDNSSNYYVRCVVAP